VTHKPVETLPPTGRQQAQSVKRGKTHMYLEITNIAPIVALVFGILILILPRVLNYLVAIYLIIIGILGILGMLT
jgi:Protein of unknown function (DUF3096)